MSSRKPAWPRSCSPRGSGRRGVRQVLRIAGWTRRTKKPEPLRVRTPATATTLRRGLISTECLYVSSYPVHWSIPPTQGTVPTSFLCPRSPILNPKMQEPRYSSASFTGTSSMRSRSKSSGGFSPWRSRTRTCSAEGYLPLRKKTHNFTPTITKTIRRANRKNASIANMVRRLAQKARRLWTWSEVGSTKDQQPLWAARPGVSGVP